MQAAKQLGRGRALNTEDQNCSSFQMNYDSCSSTSVANEEYMNTNNFIQM